MDDAMNVLLLEDEESSSTSLAPSSSGSGDDDGEQSVLRRAQSLAAVSLLQLSDQQSDVQQPQGSGSADLLQLYLAAAQIRLDELLDTALSPARSDSADISDSDEDGVADSGDPELMMKERFQRGMVGAVDLLQRIVVDVFVLFFVKVPIPKADDASISVDSKECVGLIALLQRKLLAKVGSTIANAAGSSAGSDAVPPVCRIDYNMLFHLSDAVSKPASSASGAASPPRMSAAHMSATLVAERRKVFSKWLSSALHDVTDRCKEVLTCLSSAAHVAELQSNVWNKCIKIDYCIGKATDDFNDESAPAFDTGNSEASVFTLNGDGSKNSSNSYGYTQQMWEAASITLLAPLDRSAGNRSLRSDSAAYLWTIAFRHCFLHQVEMLLQRSCSEVLVRTKRKLFGLLQRQGVNINAHNYTATCAVDHIGNPGAEGYSAGVSRLCSPKIYRLADEVRQQFESGISQLLADVINPVHATEAIERGNSSSSKLHQQQGLETEGSGDHHDPHSSGALARALRTHCAQLIGHVLLLLRQLTIACRTALQIKGAYLTPNDELYHTLRSCAPVLSCIKATQQQRAVSNGADAGSLKLSVIDGAVERVLDKELEWAVKTYGGVSLNTKPVTRTSAASTVITRDAARSKDLSVGDQCLLSALLFLGRVAWLFKIRGSFLGAALVDSPSSNTLAAGADSGVSRSDSNVLGHDEAGGNQGSFSELNTEEQFRSAFEIADTNGDGVLSFAEALEALQALSVSDVHENTSALMQQQQEAGGRFTEGNLLAAGPFGLTLHSTPSISYSEFALICGSRLMMPSDFNPLVRLHSCIDEVVATAHLFWALTTVNAIGNNFRDDLRYDLGFGGSVRNANRRMLRFSNDDASGYDTSFKYMSHSKMLPLKAPVAIKTLPSFLNSGHERSKSNTNRGVGLDGNRMKPFKSWIATEIDMDAAGLDMADDFLMDDTMRASTAGRGGSSGAKQTERIFTPSRCSTSLANYFHLVQQHIAASIISIDTMQSAGMEYASLSYNDDGLIGRSVLHLLSRSSCSSSSDGGAGNTAAGGNEDSDQTVVLAHLVVRLVTNLVLAHVHYSYSAILQSVKPFLGTGCTIGAVNMTLNALASTVSSTPSGGSSGIANQDMCTLQFDEVIEESALQAVFDIIVVDRISRQWQIFSSGTERPRATDDSSDDQEFDRLAFGSSNNITAAVEAHDGAVKMPAFDRLQSSWRAQVDPITGELVLPLVSNAAMAWVGSISLLFPFSKSASTDTSFAASKATPQQSHHSSSSEALLSTVFPSGSSASASRFVLLPLAVFTSSTGHSGAGSAGVTSASKTGKEVHTRYETPAKDGAKKAAATNSTNKPAASSWWG